MSRQFDEKMVDWVTWYREHEGTEKSIDQEIQFMKKAIRGCLALLAMACDDIRAMEQQRIYDLGQERLFTPVTRDLIGV